MEKSGNLSAIIIVKEHVALTILGRMVHRLYAL